MTRPPVPKPYVLMKVALLPASNVIQASRSKVEDEEEFSQEQLLENPSVVFPPSSQQLTQVDQKQNF